MFYIDQYYLILVVPTIILSFVCQIFVKSTFNKYSKVSVSCNLTGRDMAARVLGIAGINNVSIGQVSGSLTDHFDPHSMVLRLSNPVYGCATVSACAVAAHEAGHAIQKHKHYWALWLRSTLVPVANIGSKFGPYLAMFGIFFGLKILIKIGIILFAGAVLFYLITLPVEFNASARALRVMRNSGLFTRQEMSGARKVLTAAALTYVSSALTAFASLLRLILLLNRRR